MKVNWVFSMAVAGLLAIVEAQSQMPACAEKCLGTYLANSTCSATDFACICADVTLMNGVQDCVLGSCTIKESLTAKNETSTLCGDPIRDRTMVTPVITGVSGGLAVIAVFLRLWDQYDHLQVGDISAVASLIFALPMGGLEFAMSHLGFGKDIWVLPFNNITKIIQYTWLTEIFYMTAMGFTKITILCLYLKVFPSKPFRTTCFVTIGVCVIFALVFSLGTVFHCWPVSYGWTEWTGETKGYCINFNAFAWAHAIVNIILDLFVILLPIPQLLRLALGTRRKVHVILMFSVGFFITIVSIIRLSSLVQFARSSNATYDNVPTAYWSVLEAFVSIICTCMPAVRSILRRVFPTCFGSSADPNSYEDRNYRISTSRNLTGSGITKTVQHTVSILPKSGDSDVIELMDNEENERHNNARENGW
ncbi:hypothetical protein DTO271G3_4575 [Paecilomyces variotii]|nr:hypothetical protein DTO271G3_4575 [Paecilomyces variotii]